MPNKEPSRKLWMNRKVLATGLMVGVATGAWVSTKILRETPEQSATVTSLIDWEQARGIAINMNRGQTLTQLDRERLDTYYRDLVQKCVPIVADYTGVQLKSELDQTFAFDRVDWINANLVAFRKMFAPLEALTMETHGKRSVAANLWGGLNQKVLSAELGFLLGYLARRVLGQYDLALLGREPMTSGKLYYVEPNIRAVESALELPRDEFRMWLALHETTHAFEFEGHSWLRAHFNDLLDQYFEFLRQDMDQLKQGMRGVKTFVDRARTRESGAQSWLEAIMTPDQRALFQRMQATMCMIEGYSNHVMNAVGRELLPSYDLIARKFELRQQQRSFAEQLFGRLTGLDVKLEQYRLGQQFIDTIAAEHGHDVARRIWDGPESLPTMAEIYEPARWLARVVHS